MRLYWSDGNPAGYTDDLGIIADRNQWIEERSPGWYLSGHNPEVHKWCVEHLTSYEFQWTNPFTSRIDDDKDVMLFKLRWPVD